MEAVVWRCSSGGPWRSSGGARREVHGGRLEALAAGGGKAGSRAAQRMQNEGLRRRSWRQRPAWRRRWPGGPGGVQPGRGGMEGQVAAPHPGLEAANLEGLETAEVLEAMAGLEVEANLEVLESVGLEAAVGSNLEGLEAVVETNLEAVVGTNLEGLEAVVGTNLEGLEAVVGTNLEGLEAVVGTNLEVPAVASTWRQSAWRARRRRRPGGPGGGGVLEGPAAAVPQQKK
ncbi:uncharacterized protein LOC132452572 isoform X2 [Gadus macrocephalus]|uniref:uncharacterized protein LOC132452572 isoform X2 n=1 Tax=Gadus macrocephalus TaxID=80720 RepID=UPI0028CB7721|nr:uncharacterized protein LOC132452572 isoform X2 [Gadus macrocephalus]